MVGGHERVGSCGFSRCRPSYDPVYDKGKTRMGAARDWSGAGHCPTWRRSWRMARSGFAGGGTSNEHRYLSGPSSRAWATTGTPSVSRPEYGGVRLMTTSPLRPYPETHHFWGFAMGPLASSVSAFRAIVFGTRSVQPGHMEEDALIVLVSADLAAHHGDRAVDVADPRISARGHREPCGLPIKLAPRA